MARKHLEGRGCRFCSYKKRSEELQNEYNTFTRKGFINKAKDKTCILYLLKCWNKEECFFKIGITTKTVNKRYKGKRMMPYTFETLKEINGTAENIYNLEYSIKQYIKQYKYIPSISFCGSKTECFSIQDINLIIEKLYV